MKDQTAIITHLRADFDAAASLCAAGLLYPDAIMIKPNGLDENVNRFMSLYLPHLDFITTGSMARFSFRNLIILDTNCWSRTGIPAPYREKVSKHCHITLIDHHPGPGDIKAHEKITRETGACSTIITGMLQEKNVTIPPLLATFLFLGIHEDTGSFTYPTTTIEDFQRAGYLLNCGASMRVTRSFLQYRMNDLQKELFYRAGKDMEEYEIGGMRIMIAAQIADEYINGLDVVAQKLRDSNTVDAVFLIVHMSGSVFIVARSRDRGPDVGRLLTAFGGGGHKSTASACVKNVPPSRLKDIRDKILQTVGTGIPTKTTAASIMSSPVKTVDAATSCADALSLMTRYGISGIPVMHNEKLSGVISLGDTEKAVRHRLGHAPVKAFMSHNLITVKPESSLHRMRSLLVENNISRLPVTDDNSLVGLVSRRDILKALHEDIEPDNDFEQLFHHSYSSRELHIRRRMETSLQPHILDALHQIGHMAENMNFRAYLVGGCVRDIYLKCQVEDIDIGVEGDAIELAIQVHKGLGGKLRMHSRYRTATIILDDDGLRLDFATCRREYYEYPASAPRISRSSLREDLYRRDFTINAMAISLSPKDHGLLVDPFGGRRDLERGLLRILHSMSFIEDPARLFRASGFIARFGLRLESETLRLARDASFRRVIASLPSYRFREQWLRLLELDNADKGLTELKFWKVLNSVEPPVPWNVDLKEAFRRFRFFKKRLKPISVSAAALSRLYLIMLDMQPDDAVRFAERIGLKSSELRDIRIYHENMGWICRLLNDRRDIRPGTIYRRLSLLSPEFIKALMASQKNILARSRVERYLTHDRHVKLDITGNDLLKLGMSPGPNVGRILKELHCEAIDSGLNREEQIARAIKLIQ